MFPISNRAAIAPFLAMEVARDANARVAAGSSIVRFDVGQPHWAAPERALAAVESALRSDALGYTDGLGLAALREGISRWYGEAYGLDVPARRVVITTGASSAFVLAFLALFNTGDRVGLASPGYPPYRHILTALGFQPALIESGAEAKLQLQPAHLDALSAAGRLAGFLVASPANPTGAMLSADELAALGAWARAQGAAFISDEIYHGLTYEGPAATALAADPDAVVISSFSKYWAMTGWRVGWIVAPERLIKPLERLGQNLAIAAPTISQVAALGALRDRETCEARRAVYAENREMILAALPGLGLTPVTAPDGAFYVLLDLGEGGDSQSFCRRALDEAGVALTPGVDFCESRGKSWVRLAYARSPEEVAEGLSRLARWRGT